MTQTELIQAIKKSTSKKITKNTVIKEAHFHNIGWKTVNKTIANFVKTTDPTFLTTINVEGIGDVSIHVLNFEWDFAEEDFTVVTFCYCVNQFDNEIFEIESDGIQVMKMQAKKYAKENNMIFNDKGGDIAGYRELVLYVAKKEY